MESVYQVLKFLHVLGVPFQYHADRYMENIIRRGATRCFVFQGTVLATGVLMLLAGPLGIGALWSNWVLLVKLLLLFALMGLLSYVHLGLQPRIEAMLAGVSADAAPPADLAARLKPYRVRRKRLATVCLFLVITTIVLGLQVYGQLSAGLNIALIALAGLFAWRANRTLLRFGWI